MPFKKDLSPFSGMSREEVYKLAKTLILQQLPDNPADEQVTLEKLCTKLNCSNVVLRKGAKGPVKKAFDKLVRQNKISIRYSSSGKSIQYIWRNTKIAPEVQIKQIVEDKNNVEDMD